MCLAQGPQRSDVGEARTRGPSVMFMFCVPWVGLQCGNVLFSVPYPLTYYAATRLGVHSECLATSTLFRLYIVQT